MRACYQTVERAAHSDDPRAALLYLLRETKDTYVERQLIEGLSTDPVPDQLVRAKEAGVRVIRMDSSHLDAFLIRGGAGESAQISISTSQPWDRWPLLFAHELGHLIAPSTCGMRLHGDNHEIQAEVFAWLWLMEPGNDVRARRFLRPLWDRRKNVIRVSMMKRGVVR